MKRAAIVVAALFVALLVASVIGGMTLSRDAHSVPTYTTTVPHHHKHKHHHHAQPSPTPTAPVNLPHFHHHHHRHVFICGGHHIRICL